MRSSAISAGLVAVFAGGGALSQTAPSEKEEKFAIKHEYANGGRLLLVSSSNATTTPKRAEQKVQQSATMNLLLEVTPGEKPGVQKMDCQVGRVAIELDAPIGKAKVDTEARKPPDDATEFEKQYHEGIKAAYKGLRLTFDLADHKLKFAGGSGGFVEAADKAAGVTPEQKQQILEVYALPFLAAVELPFAYCSPNEVAIGETWKVRFAAAPLPLTTGTIHRYGEETRCTLLKVEDGGHGRIATVRLEGVAEAPGSLPGQTFDLKKTGTALFNIDKKRLVEIKAEGTADHETQGKVHVAYHVKLGDAPSDKQGG